MKRSTVDWRIWRVVLAGHGTLIDVEQNWSIDDVQDAHEAMDVKASIEKIVTDRAIQKSGR